MAPDTLSLVGKVAIVTGSGKENGIGAGIALALARNGAKVVINHVSDESGPRAANVVKKVQESGSEAIVVQADVATQEGATKVVRETLKGFGVDEIDILGKVPIYIAPFPPSSFQTGKETYLPLSVLQSQQCRCWRHETCIRIDQRRLRQVLWSQRTGTLVHDSINRPRYATRRTRYQYRLYCFEAGCPSDRAIRCCQSSSGHADLRNFHGGKIVLK